MCSGGWNSCLRYHSTEFYCRQNSAKVKIRIWPSMKAPWKKRESTHTLEKWEITSVKTVSSKQGKTYLCYLTEKEFIADVPTNTMNKTIIIIAMKLSSYYYFQGIMLRTLSTIP